MSTAHNDAMTDAAAARAARGDSDAFATLCRLLSDDVWRYCNALLADDDLAQEAAQETFVRAVTAIRRFRGTCPARVYVLVLARRSCAAVLRREIRHRDRDDLATSAEPTQDGPAGAVETTLLLAQLPPDLRQAFVLTQLLGLSYADAASVAGCRVGTIRSRVFRARERLVSSLTAAEEERRDAR